jgi:hypothetical protein
MARLIVNPGSDAAWDIQLRPGANTLGRSESNDFVLEHNSVSSAHCQVTLSERGAVLQDLGSVSGTFVEGELVETVTLRPGQTLRLGEIELRFESEGPAVGAVRRRAEDCAPYLGPGVVNREAAPVPAVSPAPASPVASAAAAGNEEAGCKFHPRTRARYRCPQCGQSFCDFCVNSREGAGAARKFCRGCAVECTPLRLRPQAMGRPEEGFGQQAAAAFGYPFAGDGLILLATGTVFYTVIGGVQSVAKYALAFGAMAIGFLTLFGTGYLLSYLRRILTSSAMGERTMPDWPDFSDASADIVVPFCQFLVTVMACFLPLSCLAIFADQSQPWTTWADGAALLFACAYFPMAFLAVSMYDTMFALNPLLVMPAISKIPREYLLATSLFAVVLAVGWVGVKFLPTVLPGIVASVVSNFLLLYLLTAEMRILGVMYRCRSAELGWFPQRILA